MYRSPGSRQRITKWIHAGDCVVRVEVEGVYPDEDPSEVCLEPDTLKFLDHVQSLADSGNVDALAKLGEVFVRRKSA